MEQQRGRPLAHLVKELVQNALDSVGGSGRIELAVTPTEPGAADLSQLNIVFVTGKKDGVTQRGRMGRGFKKLLPIATGATVRSRDQELLFTVDGDGTRRVVHRRGLDWHHGFEAGMQVEHDEAGTDLAAYFQSFLLPGEVTLTVNGAPVPPASRPSRCHGQADHGALRKRTVGEAGPHDAGSPGRSRRERDAADLRDGHPSL